MRYNTPSETGTYTDVTPDEYGNFTMPALVQMYDIELICRGTSRVGVEFTLYTPAEEIGTIEGVEYNGNTRFSWRVSQMPISGALWLFYAADTEEEYNIQWPE